MTCEAPSGLVLLQDMEKFNIYLHTLVYPSRIAQRERVGEQILACSYLTVASLFGEGLKDLRNRKSWVRNSQSILQMPLE